MFLVQGKVTKQVLMVYAVKEEQGKIMFLVFKEYKDEDITQWEWICSEQFVPLI